MKSTNRIYIFIIVCILTGFIVGYLDKTLGISIFNKPLCQNCNIVIVSIDPLRADELPCFGYIYNTTPNLCRFANRSSVFTNAFAQSSWTLPSIMTLITSRYPYEHGMLIPYQSVLSPNILTLPQVLKKAGYHTLYIGDLDNSHLPLDKGLGRGFDNKTAYIHDSTELTKQLNDAKELHKPIFAFIHNFDMSASWNTSTNPQKQFSFDPTFTPPRLFDPSVFDPVMWKESIYYLEQKPDLSADYKRILSLLKNSTSTQSAYSYFKQLSLNDQESISSFSIFEHIDLTNPQHIRLLRNLYDERLFQLDKALSPLLDMLSSPSWSKDTIVVIVANHGDELGEHGRMSHGTNLFSSTTHIPLIISIPRMPPRRSNTLVASMDLFPTLLEAIGVKNPQAIQGESLVSLIKGSKKERNNDFVISQLGPFPWLSSIRTEKWSYYEDKTDQPPSMLFDLKNDSGEQINVADTNKLIMEELRQKLRQINTIQTSSTDTILLSRP